MAGLPRLGKGEGKLDFIQGHSRSGSFNLCYVSRISKSLLKVSEMSGNFLKLLKTFLLVVVVQTRQFRFKNYLSHSQFC